MENLTPEQQALYSALKSRLQSLGPKIKSITEQGRSVATDKRQLFLFKGMYKELKPYFDTFNYTWDKIMELTALSGATSAFPTKEDKALQQAVERYYYEGCAIYEEHMNPTPQPAPSTSSHQNSSLNDSRLVRARLPQINLPSFNGNQSDWPLFRDTYKSLIHDETSLGDIEKFHFLMSCLKGPALALIKHIELQEANYAQAWKSLNDTYNDKRRLASNYLRTVLDFVPFKGRPSANALKHLLTIVGENIDSFKHLGIPDTADFILFFLLLRCLDPETRRAFEKQHAQIEFPTYKDLIDYVRIECRSLELTQEETTRSTYVNRDSQPSGRNIPLNKGGKTHSSLLVSERPTSSRKSSPLASRTKSSLCPVCKAEHTLYQCNKFRKATPTEKVALLQSWPGCINCLSSKHSKDKCTSQRRCQSCSRNHHTWLHIQQKEESPPQPTPAVSRNVSLGSLSHQGEVILGTAVIEIQNSEGKFQKFRAVTDSGSQHSFITEECARKLGMSIEPCSQTVSGIGQSPLTGLVGRTDCLIRSPIAAGVREDLNAEAIVVSRITGQLPQVPVPASVQNMYKSYVLADQEFWKPGPVEFLVGADIFFDIITGRPISVDPSAPRLLPTIFGYVIGGPTKASAAVTHASSLFVQSAENIKECMAKFWEVEEVSHRPIIPEEERICEEHFLATHRRLSSGRYVVSLPLKDSINVLSNPRQQALSRLRKLESKLNKDSSLAQDYHNFMREYLNLEHMRLAPQGTAMYTIPHHAVVKFQNGQRKLRVVFDASCVANGAGSLNDHQYAGPKLQLDIGDVITNFRTHKFVFMADIVKMYRQIQVDPAHRKYQHILWRFDPSDAIQEYELCTVTYGEKASPYLAQRCIRQLVQDEGSEYQVASRALLEDTYVDDIATGAQTVSQLMQLKEELITLLGKGGFQLSKWATNSKELLRTIQENELGNVSISLSDEDDARVKLLGIQWNPKDDAFSYEICTPVWNPTKREILSAIARIYDPLGYLSPVIFLAKTVLQEMWIAKVGWDEIGPLSVIERWRLFLEQLDALSVIRLPRRITWDDTTQYAVVGFCDASEKGYSAVLYLHAVTQENCRASLLKAKTKLSPIKPMTIPRLELSGALLLCRLFQSCKSLFSKLKITSSHFYTDSQVVLGWLSTPPETLNTFVAHRVVEISENTDINQWNYVPSEENPADCSSRGILPSELPPHALWWTGPQWFSTPPANWPKWVSKSNKEIPELKRKYTSAFNATDQSFVLDWIDRFSSYPRLVRSTAYILRFINRLKHQAIQSGPISVVEYRNAAKLLLRQVQSSYKTENGKMAEIKSLKSLHPFVDGDGLVRVGGRLQNSNLPYDVKHPFLIPARTHFTKILIDYYHIAYLHLGPTPLQSILQTKYWIVGARGIIRKRVFNCIKCFKATHSPQAPLMGNLPAPRLEEGQTFSHVGVDFGGPFYIRESLRRKAALGKAYLCLFVCMSTKAIHLELVSNCSTDAFIAALKRFVSRRGKPSCMYSDCGTNFVGAANRLRDVAILLRSPETRTRILQHTVPQEIEWSFNPPSAPHFGGLWEAGIKSCKTILHKVVGDNALTFEELTTVFCQIEGILNSRPIAPQGSDPECAECLTPGHFLIGKPIIALPDQQPLGRLNVLQRWKLVQQITQHFWQRWRLEYLHLLQQRKKWTSHIKNLSVGDLVIIKEPNTPLRSWPLARVLQCHVGKDGIVRVVTIRTPTGTYKRPVSKLVPLTPVNPSDNA